MRPMRPRNSSIFEEVHLDLHLAPHRQDTIMMFLEDDDLDDKSLESLKTSTVVFPCVETSDMTSGEWRVRRRLCEQAFRTLQRAHDRLSDQLGYKNEIFNYFEQGPKKKIIFCDLLEKNVFIQK